MDLYRIEVSVIFHPVFLANDVFFLVKQTGVENLTKQKKITS